jgi:hypothetical protein
LPSTTQVRTCVSDVDLLCSIIYFIEVVYFYTIYSVEI